MELRQLESREETLEAIQKITFFELLSLTKSLEGFLETKIREFNLAIKLAKGRSLLLGEGNLSFSVSLTKKKFIVPENLISTTYETEYELSDFARENAKNLYSKGVTILFEVDATNISSKLKTIKFDNIVFQFPNVASREAEEERNPNFILIRDFLKSAKKQLAFGGRVFITVVDNAYYKGAFNLKEAASITGFKTPKSHPFYPSEFSGYIHTMTHQEDSAIEDQDKFVTWVFELK